MIRDVLIKEIGTHTLDSIISECEVSVDYTLKMVGV